MCCVYRDVGVCCHGSLSVVGECLEICCRCCVYRDVGVWCHGSLSVVGECLERCCRCRCLQSVPYATLAAWIIHVMAVCAAGVSLIIAVDRTRTLLEWRHLYDKHFGLVPIYLYYRVDMYRSTWYSVNMQCHYVQRPRIKLEADTL